MQEVLADVLEEVRNKEQVRDKIMATWLLVEMGENFGKDSLAETAQEVPKTVLKDLPLPGRHQKTSKPKKKELELQEAARNNKKMTDFVCLKPKAGVNMTLGVANSVSDGAVPNTIKQTNTSSVDLLSRKLEIEQEWQTRKMVRKMVILRVEAVDKVLTWVGNLITVVVDKVEENAKNKRKALVEVMNKHWESRRIASVILGLVMASVDIRVDAWEIIDRVVKDAVVRKGENDKKKRFDKIAKLKEKWGPKTIARGMLEILSMGLDVRRLPVEEDPWSVDMEPILENVMILLEGGFEKEMVLDCKEDWPVGEKRKRGRKLSQEQMEVKKKLARVMKMDKDREDMDRLVRELEVVMHGLCIDDQQSEMVGFIVKLMKKLSLVDTCGGAQYDGDIQEDRVGQVDEGQPPVFQQHQDENRLGIKDNFDYDIYNYDVFCQEQGIEDVEGLS